jgi:FAD/FMN-containing dehydrogenase
LEVVVSGVLADFIERAGVLCDGILPGVRINPFGHLGDGNVHYNLSPPESEKGFGGSADRLATELGALATSMRGSFAAEHGLGRSKTGLADTLRSPVERGLMAQIKTAFDPDNLLNPGVIVRALP